MSWRQTTMKNFTDFKGTKIHYQVTGKGSDLLLLHGFLESSEIWKNFARKLSISYRVITIDLPGHGRSEVMTPVTSMDLMADAVHRVLKELDVKTCLIAGHSMGGYVTLAYAEKHPKMMKGMVLFHSQAGADSPEAQVNRERTIEIVKKDRRGFIRNFIPDLFDRSNIRRYSKEIEILQEIASSTSKEGIIEALQAMKHRPDRQHVLSQLKVPVLFIAGKNDNRIPLEVILPQSLLAAHSEILMLDRVGHMGFIEASGVVYGVLKGFAERIYR